MSTVSLVLVVFFGISLFSASLLLAACVASSRSQRIVSKQKEKLAVNHKAAKSLADMRKNRPLASSTIASVH